jgi:hypothetical protein
MMNKHISGRIIILLFAITFLATAVNAEVGCCMNPFVEVCGSQMLDIDDCCPSEDIYNDLEGPGSKEICEGLDYFFPNEFCANLDSCQKGCCCDPSPDVKFENQCIGPVESVSWTGGVVGRECDIGFCADQGLITPDISYSCEDGVPSIELFQVKGERQVKIVMDVMKECSRQLKEFIIERKDMDAGTDYEQIGVQRTRIKFDTGVKWDTNYKYRVTAVWDEDHSFPSTNETKTGNLACWHKYDEYKFCLNDAYFDNGDFNNIFEQSNEVKQQFIDINYASEFGNGVWCNGANRINLVETTCSGEEVCVEISQDNVDCYIDSDCSVGHPFGLFADKGECEGSNSNEKYCFFDYSKSLANKCYKCHPAMNCYDYKSEAACEENNCKANSDNDGCEWDYIYEDLGIGVCKSKGIDNCGNLNSPGSSYVESSEAHNFIFNGPSQEKLDALSSNDFPCGSIDSYKCEELVCEDIKDLDECAQVIEMDDFNEVTGSSLCGGRIRVCKKSVSNCVKDANADGIADCDKNDELCVKDRFPPETKIVSPSWLVTADDIEFEIFDKGESQDIYSKVKLEDGYELYVCANDLDASSENKCGKNGYVNKHQYLKLDSLTINLEVLLHSEEIDLIVGKNMLRFFTVDPYSNVEVVKEIPVSISTYMGDDGIGFFVENPSPGSFINHIPENMHILAESLFSKIYYLNLTSITLGDEYIFLSSTEDAAFTVSNYSQVDLMTGVNFFKLTARTKDQTESSFEFNVTLDKEVPNAPTLNSIGTPRVGQNRVIFTGSLDGTIDPGTTIEFKRSVNSEPAVSVGTTLVDLASKTFTYVMILPKEGNYDVNARAVDLADNKGGWSNTIEFSFADSAPTFIVDPHDGAIRNKVEVIQIDFSLIGNLFNVDTDGSYVKLRKDQIEIEGNETWSNNNLRLTFEPNEVLSNGQYEIEINSKDDGGHELNKRILFNVDNSAPEITVDLDSSEFKTKDQILSVKGVIKTLDEIIISNAFIKINEITYGISSGVNLINFDKNVNLTDGFNKLIVSATKKLRGTAIEPFTIILDREPPMNPVFRIRK